MAQPTDTLQWLQLLQQQPQLQMLNNVNQVTNPSLTNLVNQDPLGALNTITTTASLENLAFKQPNVVNADYDQGLASREPSQIAATIMALQSQQTPQAMLPVTPPQVTLYHLLQQQQQQQAQQEMLNLLLANQNTNPTITVNDIQQFLQMQMQQLNNAGPSQIPATNGLQHIPQPAAQGKRASSTELPTNCRKRSGGNGSGDVTPPKKPMNNENSPSPPPQMRERSHTLPVRIVGHEKPKRKIDPFDPIQNAKYITNDPNSPYRHHPINQKRSKNAEIIADICRDFVEMVLKQSPDFNENGLWFAKN
ncbi:unnamed protein product [Bursaphelenchus okinawaensis]|uniref:Uncharacterized protein n=1 Tax=Bursaphelenchus okinawaensis TaxID=465554 RepID=A0A811L6W9_9BILA|nr:unnamed protein product [Bursaphelenchus okinawaensis]CAG9117807.1 unnamed protein product [Bursaphelenchus okinawaensis]